MTDLWDAEPHDESAPAPAEGPPRPWCFFRSGPTTTPYAVGLESVAEVVETDHLVCLPYSPPPVLGLCALRREIVPVVRLDGSEGGPAPHGRLLVLVLRTSRGPWGVWIDQEGTVVGGGESARDRGGDPEAEGEGGDPAPVRREGPVLAGTVRRGGLSYGEIDPEATWQALRRAAEDAYCDHLDRDPSPRAPAAAALGES